MRFKVVLAAGTAIVGFTAANAYAASPGSSEPSAVQESGSAVSAADTSASTTQNSATATSATSYSDQELEQFAKAAMAIQAVQQDSTVTEQDKQAKAAAAVQQTGLAPEKFNEIASASQSDPQLMQRIQLAASKLQGPATP